MSMTIKKEVQQRSNGRYGGSKNFRHFCESKKIRGVLLVGTHMSLPKFLSVCELLGHGITEDSRLYIQRFYHNFFVLHTYNVPKK